MSIALDNWKSQIPFVSIILWRGCWSCTLQPLIFFYLSIFCLITYKNTHKHTYTKKKTLSWVYSLPTNDTFFLFLLNCMISVAKRIPLGSLTLQWLKWRDKLRSTGLHVCVFSLSWPVSASELTHLNCITSCCQKKPVVFSADAFVAGFCFALRKAM
jgi:hypothetical protein